MYSRSAAVSARPATDGAVWRRRIVGPQLGVAHVSGQQLGADAQHGARHFPRVHVRLGFLWRDHDGQLLDRIDNGPRECHQGAGEVLLIDRRAPLRVPLAASLDEAPDCGVHQPHLLHAADPTAARSSPPTDMASKIIWAVSRIRRFVSVNSRPFSHSTWTPLAHE